MKYTITMNGSGSVESARFDRWRVTAGGLKLMSGEQHIVTIPWPQDNYVASMPATQPTGGYTSFTAQPDVIARLGVSEITQPAPQVVVTDDVVTTPDVKIADDVVGCDSE